MEEYTAADYDAGAEYVVDFIVAEKPKGKKMEYLVKWKVIKCAADLRLGLCKLFYNMPEVNCYAYGWLTAYIVLLMHSDRLTSNLACNRLIMLCTIMIKSA